MTVADTLEYMELNVATIERNLRVLGSEAIGPKKSSRSVLARLLKNLEFLFSEASNGKVTGEELVRIKKLLLVVNDLQPRLAEVGFRMTLCPRA